MTGRIYFILGSTFIMGVFTGVFLYVTVFAPEYSNDISKEAISLTSTSIEGSVYGGCQRSGSCPSFKLYNNGSYQFVSRSDAEVEKGSIPYELRDTLLEWFSTSTLATESKPVTNEFCDSFVDGQDATYRVTFKGESYVLDTCTSAFARNTNMQNTFTEVWSFMQNPTTTYPVLIDKGITGYFMYIFNHPKK